MAGLALAGTVTCQAKGKAPGAGLGHLNIVGTVTTQAKGSVGRLTPAAVALIGRATMQVHARVGTSKTAALAGRVTIQMKGQAPFSGVPFPEYFAVATLMRSTAVPASGAMSSADVVVSASFIE